MTFKEINEQFKKCPKKEITKLMESYKDDSRKNVQNLIKTYENKLKKYNEELIRIHNMMSFERELYEKGIEFIGGIDEVGRGPLAGPVVSAVVVMPKNVKILYVNDSKKLSISKRNELYEEIKEKALCISVGIVDSKKIDEINILNATKKSMEEAVRNADIEIEYLLIDALKLENINIKQMAIIKGDERSHSIACASIIAKVTRDKMMVDYDKQYEGYKFASNKGYGTQEHLDGIKEKGMCEIHRRSFLKNFRG